MSEKNSKTSLYLILGIPLFGILATTLFYFYITGQGIKMDTINQGQLITPPKLITHLHLQTVDGAEYVWPQSDKWTFLVVGKAECEHECLKKMYLTRQIHTAIGKESPRINMVYLNTEPSLTNTTAGLLAKDYAHFTILQADASQVTAWATQEAPKLDMLQSANFYVIDPTGWVMMYYTDAQDYKAVIKDMKFLLSNS